MDRRIFFRLLLLLELRVARMQDDDCEVKRTLEASSLLHDEVSLAQLRLHVRRARQSDDDAARLVCQDHGGKLPDNTVDFLWVPTFANGGLGVELDALRLHQQIKKDQFQKLLKLTAKDGWEIVPQWKDGVLANNFSESQFPVKASLQDTCFHILKEMLEKEEEFQDSLRLLNTFLDIPQAAPLAKNEGFVSWLQSSSDLADIDLATTQVIRKNFCDGAGDDAFVSTFRKTLPTLQPLYRSYVSELSKHQKELFGLLAADSVLKKRTDAMGPKKMSIARLTLQPAIQVRFYRHFFSRLEEARSAHLCFKNEISEDSSGVNDDLEAMMKDLKELMEAQNPYAGVRESYPRLNELQQLYPNDDVLTVTRHVIMDSGDIDYGGESENRVSSVTKTGILGSSRYSQEYKNRFLILCNDVLLSGDLYKQFWQGGKLEIIPLADIESVTADSDTGANIEFTVVSGSGTTHEFKAHKPGMGKAWANAIRDAKAGMEGLAWFKTLEKKSNEPARGPL